MHIVEAKLSINLKNTLMYISKPWLANNCFHKLFLEGKIVRHGSISFSFTPVSQYSTALLEY